MTGPRRGVRRGGWLGALAGLAALAVVGFGVGLVTGGLLEAPDLVLGHLLGETEEIAWGGPGNAPLAQLARQPQVPASPMPLPALRDAEPAAPPAPASVAAAPPQPPRPPSAPADLPGRFSVQVGAFAESNSAERLAAELRGRGYGVYLAAGAREGESRWRVRVGPLASRAEADQMAARLKSAEKLPTWVLSEAAGAP